MDDNHPKKYREPKRKTPLKIQTDFAGLVSTSTIPVLSEIREISLHDHKPVKQEIHPFHENRSDRWYTGIRNAVRQFLNDSQVNLCGFYCARIAGSGRWIIISQVVQYRNRQEPFLSAFSNLIEVN